MDLSISIIGAEELAKAISGVSKFALKEISDGLNKTAFTLEAKAKANAPHKHGALRGSIHTNESPGHLAQVEGSNITAVVGTNLKYALAQEFGTEGMVIQVPNGRRIVRNGETVGHTGPYSFHGAIVGRGYMSRAHDDIFPTYTRNMVTAMDNITHFLAGK